MIKCSRIAAVFVVLSFVFVSTLSPLLASPLVASSSSQEYELVVRFKPGVNGKAVISQVGGTIVNKNGKQEYIPELNAYLVRVEAASEAEAINLFKSRSEVVYAEKNRTITVLAVPNDTFFGRQWGLYKVNAPLAWDETTGSASVVVAVVDTGVDIEHPDLASKIWQNSGEVAGNGLDDDGNGFVDDVNGWNFYYNYPVQPGYDDGHGHGTHVAGIIAAATNNATGVAGGSWNVQIMPVAVLNENGEGTSFEEAKGIVYAVDEGADVINLSLKADGYSSVEQEAINYALESDVVVVAAAGNDGAEPVVYPSAHPGVISVGASSFYYTSNGIEDTRADFSNYGAGLDVMAPGAEIFSTFPYDYAHPREIDPTRNVLLDQPGELAEQRSPDVWEERVVWTDYRNSSWAGADIYFRDLSSPISAEMGITTGTSGNQENPAIYGDRIVWQDDRNGNYDIYLYDLSTGTETRLTTSSAAELNPDIYGDWVVWETSPSPNNIYAYNLSSSALINLTASLTDPVANPAIFRDKVVFQVYRSGNWDLYLYDLSLSSGTFITTHPANQTNPDIWVNSSGNYKVVWEDDRNAYYTGSDIYLFDSSAPVVDGVQIVNLFSYDRDPAIYGDVVVYTHEEESPYTGEGIVYILDFNLAAFNPDVYSNGYPITEEELSVLPAIWGDRVVWEDHRNLKTALPHVDENSDIYTFEMIKYRYMSGTSMASPHVAALAALLRSVSPTLTAAQVENIIERTAYPFGKLTPDPDPTAGWPWYGYTGYGRVDFYQAVHTVTAGNPIYLDKDEPNNVPSQAVNLGTLSTSLETTSFMGTNSDTDYFLFRPETDGDVEVKLENIPPYCDYDLYVHSGDTNGTQDYILESSVNEGNADEAISFSVTADTTYVVEVRNAGKGFNDGYPYPDRDKPYLLTISLSYGTGGSSGGTTGTASPQLSLSSNGLNFNLEQGEVGPTTEIFVANSGIGTFNWSLNCDEPWIWIEPLSGSADSTFTVKINATALDMGSYSGDIQVQASAGTLDSPQTINVNLMVQADFPDVVPELYNTLNLSTVRVYGSSRYETAVSIAEKAFSSAQTVILATGENFPDALAAAPLAGKEDAPILLTQSSSLPSSVLNEIKSLGANKVIIVGGTLAVSSSIKTALENEGFTVERISGSSRYDTAAKIAQEVGSSQRAFLTTGENFPDALSVSSYAFENQVPVLLTQKDSLPTETKNALSSLGVQEVIIVGGEAAVSESVENWLSTQGYVVRRIAGQSRYETSANLVSLLYTGPSRLTLATGENFPDALCGGPLAAKKGAPLLLTKSSSLTDALKIWLNREKSSLVSGKAYILGGTQAISSDVVSRLREM